MLERLLARNETLVGLIMLAVCVITALVNPAFLSLATLFDLLRAAIVPGIFAVAVLLVLVSGGIDVSFTAIAAFSMYTTTLLLTATGIDMHWAFAFLIAMGIGLGLGMVNAVFIGLFRLPTLIVTLGTLSAFRGFLLTFVGKDLITNMPPGLRDFARTFLMRGTTAEGFFFSLPIAFALLVAVIAITWFLLNRTMLGRAIFAMGGSREAADRIGIDARRIQFFIYGYVGAVAGLAGIVHASLARVANPFDLVGLELNVIAAVVLGGARLTGGHGTVLGTLLGVGLIVVITNSLILLGIPSSWQSAVIGLLILVGTGIPTLHARLAARRA